MEKPTSAIIADLIKFVRDHSKVREALERRDNDDGAACSGIRCRFYKKHNSDPARSAYVVAFIYAVKDDDLEQGDDVLVRVERNTNASPAYKVLSVKFV